MANYQTPGFDYSKAQSELTKNKGMQDAAAEYGRFLSQQRFRNQRADMDQNFQRGMPKVGRSFNSRGLYNSGLRQSGQRQYAGEYQQGVQRLTADQAAAEQGFQMEQAQRDAAYQAALLDLYERMQQARAVQDPFANVVI